MKKLLLTLLGTIALTSTANAVEPITADFSTWETTTISTTETTATVDGVKYGFLGANINKGYNDAPNYLFIQGKKQKEPKAYVTFTLPFDCSKIVLTPETLPTIKTPSISMPVKPRSNRARL